MFIEVNNVTKTLKGVNVLEDISISLERGRIYGLRGKKSKKEGSKHETKRDGA